MSARLAQFLDATIGVLAPSWALRRARARQLLAAASRSPVMARRGRRRLAGSDRARALLVEMTAGSRERTP